MQWKDFEVVEAEFLEKKHLGFFGFFIWIPPIALKILH